MRCCDRVPPVVVEVPERPHPPVPSANMRLHILQRERKPERPQPLPHALRHPVLVIQPLHGAPPERPLISPLRLRVRPKLLPIPPSMRASARLCRPYSRFPSCPCGCGPQRRRRVCLRSYGCQLRCHPPHRSKPAPVARAPCAVFPRAPQAPFRVLLRRGRRRTRRTPAHAPSPGHFKRACSSPI